MMANNDAGQNSGAAKGEMMSSIRRDLALSEPFDRIHHRQAAIGKQVSEPKDESTRDQLIEIFQANLELVGGQFRHAGDISAAGDMIRQIIAERGAAKVAVSDSAIIKEATAGLDVVENASAEFLFGSDLGITGAQWGIAETGTLVLESDMESHRLTSLVPPVHVCLVRAENIRESLGEILVLTGASPSPTITFITGASRTSDIELTLAIGVHGPRELYVIVVENS